MDIGISGGKKLLKGIVRYFGYTVARRDAPIDPQLERQVTPKDFLDVFFAGIRPEEFFFLQIGAHDGSYRDPLHEYIVQYRLSGVLVEPQKETFERLRETYKGQSGLTFANVAVSERSGTQTMYRVKPELAQSDASWSPDSISSFDKATISRMVRKRIPKYIRYISDTMDDYLEEVPVHALSLEDLIKEYGITRIDLLQLDCEGYDHKILKMFDFQKFRPRLINYESKVLSDADRALCEQLLESIGYRLFRHRGDTCAFKV